MNTIRITTPQNIELDYELSSVGERIVAYLIDAFILIAYFVFLMFVLFNGSFYRFADYAIFLIYLPVLFYHVLSEVLMNGQTVGKKAMKIRVISLDGAGASLGQYLIRWVFRLVDFSLTGGLGALLSVAVSARRQRIGDLVAGTTLIRTVPRTHFQETMYMPKAPSDYVPRFPEVENLSDADMQLVKEVILTVRKTGNSLLALHAAEKIEATLNISRGQLEPMPFLTTLLADYNAITSRV